jgi:cytochrome P450
MTMAYERFLDYASRADPYPLLPELRKTPVARQPDGSYVVSTYREIVALLHDPRVSSDLRNLPEIANIRIAPDDAAPQLPPEFIRRDPPDHDRLRSMVMKHAGDPVRDHGSARPLPGRAGRRPCPQPRRRPALRARHRR